MNNVSYAVACLGMVLAAPFTWAQSLSASTQTPLYQLDGKPVLGRIEQVYYNEIPALKDVPFVGKIDTGADTTSMHAENIRLYSHHPEFKHLNDQALMWAVFGDLIGTDGRWDAEKFAAAKWGPDPFDAYQVHVTFTIPHPFTGEAVQIDDELERLSVIRNRTSEVPILRPTISLPLTIAGQTVDTEVNLTKRSQFSAPILIGKTYLDDKAWVLAGYDYLQQQPNAQMVGKKETVKIQGLPYQISISTSSRYTSAHALDIDVDKRNKQVSFTLEGKNGQRQPMTLPLVRMLKVSGEQRPLVYLPVSINEDETQYWLVYLRDRSDLHSQIRLGKDIASQYFVIDTGKEHLLAGEATSFQCALKSKPLVISPKETVSIDGHLLPAYPSFTVKTPLLRVDGFELSEKGQQDVVTFYLPNENGTETKISKPVLKKLKVGNSLRPVVSGKFLLGEQEKHIDFAIDVLDQDDSAQPFFTFGQHMAKGGVLLNTRSEHLLDAKPLFKAGHIEVAEVDGLSFPVKLDTGADVSSINAQNIKPFKKNGVDMVSFTYQNDHGIEQRFTKPVVDVMRITAKKGEKTNVRPVVEMHVTLGDLEKKIRVNLQDRSRFHYSMILGKNFLQYGVLVASDTNYIVTEKPDYEQ